MKKVELEITLIVAASAFVSPQSMSVCLIVCWHKKDLNVRDAVMEAFTDWSETPKGQKFIESRGTNWGDSLFIRMCFLSIKASLDMIIFSLVVRQRL